MEYVVILAILVRYKMNKRAMMALDRSPELRLVMKVMTSVEYKMLIKGSCCFSSGGNFV